MPAINRKAVFLA